MAQFWENDAVVAPQQRSAPQPILTLPSASKEQERQNDSIRTDIAVQGNARAQDDAVRGENKFAQDLRKEFNSLKQVQEYQAVVRQFNTALNTEPTPSGDQALITAYAKMLDPGSVVRETEFDVTAQADSAIGRTVARLGRELGIDGQGRLSEEARKKVRQEMLNLTRNYNASYNQARKQFGQIAQQSGFQPDLVIGPHLGGAYFDGIKSALERDRAPDQARQPEMRGGLPVGTQVQFGGGDAGPFDRAAYLKETLGITPDQESVMIGFWNANRGNQNLTPEQVTQFYAANGLPAPDPAMLGQSIDQAKKGFAFQGLDTSQAEAAYRTKLEQRLNASGFDPNSAGAYGDRLDQGLLQGLADEFVGVGGGLAAAFQNEGIGTGYTEARDLERLKQEQMREAQGVSGYATELAGNFAGGLALPGATANGVRGAATAGATAGGIAGFGYGEGLGGSVGGAALGAGVGAGLGAGAGKLGDVMAARQAARIQNGGAMPSATADAYAQAQKYGMDLSIGDVRGMGAKATERLLDVQPGGAEVMNAARTRLTGQMERAADNVASTFGPETSYRGMGEAAQAGVKNWRGRFDALSEKLYNAIPIKRETRATVDNTRAALRDMTDIFRSNPDMRAMMRNGRFSAFLDALTPGESAASKQAAVEAAQAKVVQARAALEAVMGQRQLSGLRMPDLPEGEILAARKTLASAEADYASAAQNAAAPVKEGDLSWEDLKHFRSIIGEQVGEAIITDGARKSQLRGLYAALSRDMEATAQAQGPAAFRAFKRANDAFAEGQNKLERVWSSLLGPDGNRAPEAAAGFIQRIAKEGKGSADLRQLAELRQTLKPDEWGQVSNGLIRLMGQPANSAGREFNPGTFMRVFDDMTPEAKNLLFGGANKPLRQNLDEFSQVIGRIAANDSTRNTSKTAMGLAGLTGFGLGGIPGVLGQAVMSYGAAKLWTSPSFVRWATGYSKMLAGAAKNGAAIKGGAFDSQMKALGRVASADSVIAADALGLQRQLIAAFEQGPQRLAADPVDQAPVETTRTGPAGQ